MPKISHAGPSYYGAEGQVEDANGVKHELDPTRDVYGDDTDGLEIEDPNNAGLPGRADEDDIEREEAPAPEDPALRREAQREENSSPSTGRVTEDSEKEKEEKTSAGNSSAASSSKTQTTSAKNSNRR